MAEFVEFLFILWMVCLKLFPSLIFFDENADGVWKGGCTIVHSFCIGSIWLELFVWGYGGWRCAIKILTDHGTDSSMCIYGLWLLE